ncbi:CAP domain-containing protein [Galbibacter sp.]|jgi:uncharacterized protein YkwD|uniref:CAP domain-containing protein n=1 Tax=Galbibacter sp. TaxID=2918471 RepID=UPI003A8E70DA
MDAISKIKAWSVALISCFCLLSCSDENVTEEIIADPSVDYLQMETQILEQINKYRLSQGLTALEPIALIAVQADDHNHHMIANREVCHHGFGTREKQLGTGLGAQVVAENVGYGFQTAEGLVQAWIQSEDHKKNMEGDFDSMGIAASQNEDGLYYFTNIFVKR